MDDFDRALADENARDAARRAALEDEQREAAMAAEAAASLLDELAPRVADTLSQARVPTIKLMTFQAVGRKRRKLKKRKGWRFNGPEIFIGQDGTWHNSDGENRKLGHRSVTQSSDGVVHVMVDAIPGSRDNYSVSMPLPEALGKAVALMVQREGRTGRS